MCSEIGCHMCAFLSDTSVFNMIYLRQICFPFQSLIIESDYKSFTGKGGEAWENQWAGKAGSWSTYYSPGLMQEVKNERWPLSHSCWVLPVQSQLFIVEVNYEIARQQKAIVKERMVGGRQSLSTFYQFPLSWILVPHSRR